MEVTIKLSDEDLEVLSTANNIIASNTVIIITKD